MGYCSMEQKKKYSLLKHLDFFVWDLVCLEISFWGACMIRKNTVLDLMDRYLGMACLLAGAFLVIILFWNAYSGILRRGFKDEFCSTFGLVASIFVTLTMYCFATKTSEDYSRAVLFTFFVIAFPAILIERILWKEYVRRKVRNATGEVLLFTKEEDIDRRIGHFTNRADSGVIVTGIITYEKSNRTQVNGIPIVGYREELFTYVDKHQVDCVYVCLKDVSVHEYIDHLVRKNIVVYRSLRNLEKSSFRYSVTEMNGYKTLCIREKELSLGFAVSKRIMDILVALFALVVSLPITVITAIAIKMEDGGPVIYKSERIGQYGKKFYIYKFRSMKLHADKLENMLSPKELEQYYKEFKLEHDPRITKVGHFIRKHSIDELPQFLNILKGDMALIGPRPLIAREVEVNYPNNSELLLSLKPGLTGYWQAYARNNVGYEDGERQKMELYYIEHSCWKLDVRILFRTAKVVLSGEGAQ